MIFDALSVNVFEQDLIRILDGESVEVDDSFLKVSAFNQEIQDSEGYEDAYNFYDMMLADLDDVGALLGDVCADGPGSDELDLEVDNVLFKSFLDRHGISENVAFTAVFAYTLSRFAGSDKVIFNISENGRDRFNNLGAIGMFVNTLPLLVDCKDQEISSFMDYVSGLVYDVMKYNYYPFRLLATEYDIDSSIIFQYLPEWIQTGGEDEKIACDNETKFDYLFEEMDDFITDLNVNIVQRGPSYLITVMYSDNHSKVMMERLMRTYKLVLSQVIGAESLSEINYITESDLNLLNGYNDTDYPLKYDDLLDAFNDNLAKYPDSNLVSYRDNVYTHAETAFIADKIARKLEDLSVGVQDNVAFLVERSEHYMFSALAVMSVGAVYVPLDDAHPDDRLEFILNDTGAKVVLVSDGTLERAKGIAGDNAVILNISDIVKEDIGTMDALPVAYGSVACMLYTSGTTGLPKGVKVTRKSLLNISQYYEETYDMSHDDVYGLFAAIGFDAGTLAIGQCIYSGSCLSIVPEDIKLDVHQLNDYFMEQGVTHTMITTQVGKLFMESVENDSLSVLLVGGEKLGEFTNNNDYQLVDGFGPTETFSFVTSIPNADKLDPSSIGFLNYNTKAYVLDDEFRQVPVGAIGELYISGYQVAEGYLNREEENTKAFLENPFEDGEGHEVLYRSGDMVRILADGSFAIVGRRDSQVKVRGNRVELSEIESVIRDIDYVTDVTVQTIKNGTNNELVAYVVADFEGDDEELKESISTYVRERKPEYMVPSYVIRLDIIPLNVNGKVDKRALPEVDIEGLRAEYVAPETETEKLIVDAFEAVFNQDRIGVLDDFVHLGGDSLTAIKVLSYLKDYNVTAADILSLHTPRAIAENIKKDSLDLDLYNLETGCPLNEAQLNVYLDIIANNKVDAYLIPLVMDISNEYTVDDIKSALDVMFDVHPILAMAVNDDYEVPYLVESSNPSISVQSDIDEELITGFLTGPFDLHDSLSRFMIVENEEDYSLFAVFHHIIFDALSAGVFKQNLLRILEGETVEMDDSFLKVSAFNHEIQNTEEYADAGMFYDIMLADLDEAGTLFGDVCADGPGLVSLDLEVDEKLFKSFLNKHGISENIAFTTAFAYTLSRFAGSEKVIFNISENGRDRFNNLDAIGMFVTTLPVLVDCKEQSISSFMDYMSGLVYDVMKYNYYPFRVLATEYDIDSSILFQYMPEWIGIEGDGEESNDVIGSRYEGFVEEMDDLITDFNVDIVQQDSTYIMNITYSEKYSRVMMERFMESYKLILSQLISAETLSDINYVLESDLELLDSINQTEHALDYDDILDAFNDNLSNNPDSNLVSFNDEVYTYAEGAFIAGKIAESLKDLGVGIGDNVAFLVERSELYMFSVLGILSTGAAYVPLDDAHPDDRIQFILNDTDPKVVLVSDETCERAENLIGAAATLNVSDILKEDIGTLEELPVAYGSVACMLYTSGTTGVPKGVKVTRKSALNVPTYYNEAYGLTNDDVYGMFATVGFDAGSWAILSTICAGACLAIIPEDIRLDMNAMNDYFIKQGVTHTFITTQVGKLFVDSVEDTSLDVLVVGGEKLGEFASPENYELIDIYGPTEAFVFVASKNNNDKIDSSSVGDLIYNTKAYILDEEFRRVPVGAVGELYLAGDQIAEGYLNNEEETSHAFIDNPFGEGDYGVLYRTGDMVRVLPDKSLGVVGRRDSQVKIRGNRVELSEIESVIREMDYVDDVTVQTIKHDANSELVAYVVVSNELEGDMLKDAICDYVGERKPEYMIPSFVIGLDEIPVNVNGKVDRRALPEVDLEGLRVEYVAPTTEAEKDIVEAFEQVFNQDRIGVLDDFIRLGGDSLTAIKVLSYLKDYNVAAADILSLHTPQAIAQNIKKFADNY